MKKKFISGLLLAGIVMGISGCGGGGGGSSSDNDVPPTKAVVKVSTVAQAGLNPSIKGLELTVILPQGVTVKSVTSPSGTKVTDLNVVKLSGIFASGGAFANITSQMLPRPMFGTYSAAPAPGRGVVKIKLASSAPFGPGEFLTLDCVTSARTSDFQLTGFLAGGTGGTDITSNFQSPTFTVEFF
jgi:hypothetical protein